MDPETRRLDEDARREKNWKRWGPYLAERQWGTVREDYSADGDAWGYFPHDHARSRAYRWGEDGLLGICDREGRLCFAWALWNGRDPILKERLFGLSNPEGNHGEDVKEEYFYLDSTPTHSYMRALYKYPQEAFPYARLVDENRERGRELPEFELADTGIFDGGRYFDVEVEYAKAGPDDLLIRVTVHNRAEGGEPAVLHLLPTLWFRNTWSWGRNGEGYWPEPRIAADGRAGLAADHAALGHFHLAAEEEPEALLFTDNETNVARLYRAENPRPYVKDAFHEAVVHGRAAAVNPAGAGTKAALHFRREIAAGGSVGLRFRLTAAGAAAALPAEPFAGFDALVAERRAEAEAFYASRIVPGPEAGQEVVRQAFSGLLWNKQYYGFGVRESLGGDPAQPPPPAARRRGRNAGWPHLYCRDVLSMPDSWEYPWFAAWDLAFHMLPLSRIDPELAKAQLLLLLREWYMHPNGELPAYEWSFDDANPPVHAWACWRVYKMTGPKGARDVRFLARAFQKLLLNFTWWVNRKDTEGNHLFSGGFLGLDNIGVFDRSRPLPGGASLEQADATAWMAFYCTSMLSMALELARHDPAYEDVATKFFEHFVAICDAMNSFNGTGLWDEEDGFYYDQLLLDGQRLPLKVRSMVGVIPLFGASSLSEQIAFDLLPGFAKRMRWFLDNRQDLARHVTFLATPDDQGHTYCLLAIPSRERLIRVLRRVLDEGEFLSPYGVRSLSRVHLEDPYVLKVGAEEHAVRYLPGESHTGMFGGNSNWRGPVWFPLNFLLVEALERYHHFYGDSLKVECPTGSGRFLDLDQVASELKRRLASLFLPGEGGERPCHGPGWRFTGDPHWRGLVPFHEYFHGDDGRGLGASHQTGWTALVALLLNDLAAGR
jgi:hypothetical protein